MEAKLVLEMLEILDVIHRQFQGIIKKKRSLSETNQSVVVS